MDFRALPTTDPDYKTMDHRGRRFELLIGASAADIRCCLNATLEINPDPPLYP